MTGLERYVFFLCLIVFALLTGLFIAMLSYIVKTTLKTIRHGLEDERIKKEYEKQFRSASVRLFWLWFLRPLFCPSAFSLPMTGW